MVLVAWEVKTQTDAPRASLQLRYSFSEMAPLAHVAPGTHCCSLSSVASAHTQCANSLECLVAATEDDASL